MPPKEPVKQFVGVHIRKDVAERLAKLALRNDRSLAGELRRAITQYLETEEAEAS
jgi:predicted transcriptional regulator